MSKESVLDRVICPRCEEEQRKSVVNLLEASQTLMAGSPRSWDQDGNPVSTKPNNTATYEFVCNRGHHFTIKEKVF